MSTIYTFHRECAALLTPAAGDRFPVADVSTNSTHPTKKDVTLTVAGGSAGGNDTDELVGFYGVTPVDQGTMTATCLTALTTNPTFSSTNSSGVYGFSSSTAAAAVTVRVRQMQVDILKLMQKIDSTGLVDISGV